MTIKIRAREKAASEEAYEDLVDVLLRLQEHGEFPPTDSNIKAVILDIFSGGSETSSTVVEWAMSDGSADFMGTNFEFIPFGAGRRICPGILFALPNVELPLAQLLFHFDWELPGETKPEDIEMAEIFGLTVRRKNTLLLVPTPRHGSTVS
ncbi:hypothetical protein PTKIN_Ptkin14bG0014000 [Pterospermum kingtungense]